jgi:hypothetical protein
LPFGIFCQLSLVVRYFQGAIKHGRGNVLINDRLRVMHIRIGASALSLKKSENRVLDGNKTKNVNKQTRKQRI